MSEHGETFRQEAEELLAEMESVLLSLAEEPEDAGLVDRVFRSVHTLKGSGAMFGFEPVVALAHELETVLDCVREGALRADRHLVNLGLGVCDSLRRRIAGDAADPAGARLSEALRALVPGDCDPSESPDAAGPATFRLRIRPAPDLLSNGTRPLLLLEELRAMGSCEVRTRLERVPPLADLDPERCYLAWDVVLSTDRDVDAVQDVFIFTEDRCRVALTETDVRGRVRQRRVFGNDGSPAPSEASENEADPREFPERRKASQPEFESESEPEPEAESKRERRPGPEPVSASDPEPPEIPAPDNPAREFRSSTDRAPAERATVRVPAERLDALVDLVGEMVTVQAGLSRHARESGEAELMRLAEAMERLTADLRDTTIRVRMTPLETAFGRLRRLVHDLSEDLGKPAALETRGGETELDKSVIEGLMDPMVHILRNALDHGIESPEVRAAAGKPPEARVRISARHAGGSVVVRLSDDGAGIDDEAVRERAAARGLLPPDARPDREALFRLMFRPGFSTRTEASALSGRGVGLDVVRDRVESLRGRIEVESRPGEGAAFVLTLPLTLAIIEGLLVRVGGTRYVLPLSSVESCMEGGPSEDAEAVEDGLIRFRGEALARIGLRRLFRVDGTPGADEQFVIVRAGGRRAALEVDEVIGDHQTVIKSLGAVYRRTRVFSGATVLDDGRVALILDPQRLVEIAEAEQFLEAGEAGTWLSPS